MSSTIIKKKANEGTATRSRHAPDAWNKARQGNRGWEWTILPSRLELSPVAFALRLRHWSVLT